MLRLLIRAVGLLFLAGAFAAAVIDGARSIADGKLTLTPMGKALATTFPARFALLEPFVRTKLHPLLWDPILLKILYAPAWLDLGVLGLVLMVLSRPQARDRFRP